MRKVVLLMLQKLNSPFMYLVCGLIILFVAIVCLVFLVRSYRAGKAMGMDPKVLKRAITSSATFTVLPAVGILLGVIALSEVWVLPGHGCGCPSSEHFIMRRR